MAPRRNVRADRVPSAPPGEEPSVESELAPGVVAEKWCMYWRDNGEHNMTIGVKGKPSCTGCGAKR